jgi:hypothetical protein
MLGYSEIIRFYQTAAQPSMQPTPGRAPGLSWPQALYPSIDERGMPRCVSRKCFATCIPGENNPSGRQSQIIRLRGGWHRSLASSRSTNWPSLNSITKAGTKVPGDVCGGAGGGPCKKVGPFPNVVLPSRQILV